MCAISRVPLNICSLWGKPTRGYMLSIDSHWTRTLCGQQGLVLTKNLAGSFSVSPLPTERLRQWGSEGAAPIIMQEPNRWFGPRTPRGGGVSPAIKDVTRGCAQTQGATNTTSPGEMRHLCRSEGRGMSGEKRSSLTELMTPALRAYLLRIPVLNIWIYWITYF